MPYNPNKILQVELELNCPSMQHGYTVWHIINGERKRTMSRKADGKDFDWMTDKQLSQFDAGKYRFPITASDASQYFEYIY